MAEQQQNREPETDRSDEETIDEPVMDGATDHSDDDVDPRKGQTDPALIRDIESGKKTANPYG